MLTSGLYVTVTGLIADLFGLHQFVFHAYAGYICALAVLTHIGLNSPRIYAYLRSLFDGRSKTRRQRSRESDPKRSVGRRDLIIAALSAVGGFFAGWLIPEQQRSLPGDAADIGELYHRWSMPGHGLDFPIPSWGERPASYKTYPDAEHIPLPEPSWTSNMAVGQALEIRRSHRDYAARSLSKEALSALLYAAQGITLDRLAFRAAPSAGALYPIELYPVVHNVEGVSAGVYHYAVRVHGLERLEAGDFRGRVTRAGLHQAFLGDAGVCFLLTAVFQRTRWKYHQRAYRYVLLEAGHVAQNIYLAATSLALGACAVGAFYDRQFNDLLRLDVQEEAVVYLVSVGEMA